MATVTTQNTARSSMPGMAPVQQHYPYAQISHHQHSQPSSPHRTQHQPYYHHNAAPASVSAMPSYRFDSAPRMTFDTLPPSSTSSAAASHRGSYETYASTTYHSPDAHMRAHSLEELYTSQQLPVKKRARSKMYPSEEARQAAKLIQRARRREQNRNAQRRLRDRKEEHIFKLEGEVAQLRRQGEEFRTEVQGLEEMIRRLLDQKSELVRKLEGMGVTVDAEMGRLPPLLSDPSRPSLRKSTDSFPSSNALGLSSSDSSDQEMKEPTPSSGVVSPLQSSTSSSDSSSTTSVATPRSPSFLSPTGESNRSRSSVPTYHSLAMPRSPAVKGSDPAIYSTDMLPRIKVDPMQPGAMGASILPPLTSQPQWMHQ
ncbi:hypothetical protein NDA16_003932 [Ustilago loliicola]|nr:hypothetical protein NDA16_003932 [Ustilago loliicola]